MTDGAPDVGLLDGVFYAGDRYPAFAWMRRNQPVYRDPQSGVGGDPVRRCQGRGHRAGPVLECGGHSS